MKLHNLQFLIFYLLIIVTIQKRIRQHNLPSETVYSIRTTNITDCRTNNPTDYFQNLKLETHGHLQYVSLKVEVEEPITVRRIKVRLERCQGFHFACEYFQTWNLTGYCVMAKMRNQIWSPVAEAVTPATWRKTCPHIDKGTYRVTNGSLDVNAFLKFYNEAVNYHWKIFIYVFNEMEKMKYCMLGEGFFYSNSVRKE